MIKPYIKLMRPKHYIKNILVFAAIACSGSLFDPDKLLACLSGFVSFCFLSSVVYIINDIKDRDKDRLHPQKCNRPIASGAVSIRSAIFEAAVLFVIAAALNIICFNLYATILISLYLLLNLAYSFGLKNVPLIDITILASGFVFRIIYGSLITGIKISNWLYLCVFALSFYFALSKRRNELKLISDGTTREVLRHYPISFLDKSLHMCMTLGNVFYALWSVDEATLSHYDNNLLVFTVPIVLIITMKYNLNVERSDNGDPVEVLLHNKSLILLCSLYIVLMFATLYLF